MKRWIALSSVIIIILSLFTGCTGVKEVAVTAPVVEATAQDLSIYIVEEPVAEEAKAVPYHPELEYIDTAYFTKMMEAVSKTSPTRQSYDQFPAEWNFVLIDARPSKVYQAGHIGGAINIPDAEFDKYQHLLPAEKDKLLVFYCGGMHCGLSKNAALKAKKLGYTNIKVYQEGTPAWQAAGHSLDTTPEYVNNLIMDTYVSKVDNKPYLIIDARPYASYFAEHIPNSIQMDDTMFAQKYLASMPKDKKTEIIVYCGGFMCGKSHNVADILVANGYTNVKVLAGGLPVWKASGLPTFGMSSTGGTFDVSAGKVERGLTPAQFVEKLEKGSNIAVIDVRTADERAGGFLPGSIHIPDSQIHADPKGIASLLPKDKNTTLLIHCASGARAAGVVDKIADLGYPNTFYLNNKIIFTSDGKYSF